MEKALNDLSIEIKPSPMSSAVNYKSMLTSLLWNDSQYTRAVIIKVPIATPLGNHIQICSTVDIELGTFKHHFHNSNVLMFDRKVNGMIVRKFPNARLKCLIVPNG